MLRVGAARLSPPGQADRRLWFLVPGDLRTPTGGYRYDRRILVGLPALGWAPRLVALHASFPQPTPAALGHADVVLAAIPDGGLAVVDGLAYGAMPELAQREGRRLRLAALVHHPLAAESGLSPDTAEALRRSETQALAQARLVLVTSQATARLLQDYGVRPSRVRVVEPGTDPAPRAHGSPTGLPGMPRILCVAALVPRKGHDLLLQALTRVLDLPWHLDCVGSLDRDPAWAQELARLRERLGLGARVTFRGAVPELELARCYARADAFILATRFEGYGMVLAEALAWGLPILATRCSAVIQTVPAEAGILVPPEDPDALGNALRALLVDTSLRRRCAAGARRAGRRLPTWGQVTAAFAAACEEVLHG